MSTTPKHSNTVPHEGKILASPPPPLLNEKQLAEYLGVSVRKIQNDRLVGGGVPFVKLGRSVRYAPQVVAEYLAAQSRSSTSEEG